jgi:hypothetical protein
MFVERQAIVQCAALHHESSPSANASKIYRAPFRVQEVVQVVMLPRSHLMQALTHWFMIFGLNRGYREVAQPLVDPVTSGSDPQADTIMAAAVRTATLAIMTPSYSQRRGWAQ